MENSESRAGAELILNSQGKKKGMRKKCFLLGQLTACCCSTLPEAMQPQLHHLHWKGAREEGAAERATPPGSSPVMAVPGCEFTSTPFPDPISCSQALTLLNCFFVFFFFSCVLYPAVLMTSLPIGSGILHLSSASLTPWIHEGQHPGQQHGEVPLTMEALGTKNKTQNEISVRKEQNCSKLLVTSVTRGRSAMFLPVFSSKIPIDFNTVGYVPVHWNKLSVYGCRQGELASSKAMFNLSVLRSSSKGVSPFNPYLSEVTPKEMERSACHSFVFLSLTSYRASHFVYTFPFDTWHAKLTNFIWGHNANVFMLSEHRLGEMNKE